MSKHKDCRKSFIRQRKTIYETVEEGKIFELFAKQLMWFPNNITSRTRGK